MNSAHFLTTARPQRLAFAIIASALLHALPFVSRPAFVQKPVSTAAMPLNAELRPLSPPPPTELPLSLPETPKAQTAPANPRPQPSASSSSRTTPRWSEAVKQQLKNLQEKGLFYPEEAIRLGQQGSALVFMIVDESGAVVAARIEESSGFPVLDAAALRAVRALRSLPADTPREALLPVRFRLN